MGREAALEARRTNRTANGAAPAEFRGGLSHMGTDNSVRIPFRVVLLGFAVLAGGICGYILASGIGMWIGFVASTVLGVGAVALFESRAARNEQRPTRR